MFAFLVGVVAGVGAVAFDLLSTAVTHFTLTDIAGYMPGGPNHEMGLPGLHEAGHVPFRPWVLLLLLTGGGLLSGLIVFTFAPTAEGDGTDGAIDAYHNRRGVIPIVVPLVKTVASAITLGTGGSGGREGPISQIGAGIGSFLGTKLKLTDSQRRVLLLTGIGSGLGAIFHAPLAGSLFAIEVLYRDPDFEAEALIPAFLGTTVSYSIFAFALGLGAFQPLFTVGPVIRYTKPFLLLVPLGVLALLMAVCARIYVKVYYGIQEAMHRIPGPRIVRPALGALLTGVVALVFFYSVAPLGSTAQFHTLGVLHYGYGFLQEVLDPTTGELPIAVLLLVGFGKMVTTGLTLGSGGSGGVFGPSMVIGGSLGAVVGAVFHHLLPGVVSSPEVVIFALLGMASFFAAAAKTPVSTLIMVSELTSGYALLLPSMWVCAIAYLTGGTESIYREQVTSRVDSAAHRGDFIVDIVEGMSVREALTEAHRKFVSVQMHTPLLQLSRMITDTVQASFPVVDSEGRYAGLFSLDDIRAFLYDTEMGALAIAEDVAAHDVEPLRQEMSLSEAIHRFAESRYDELPVVDSEKSDLVIAMLRRRDVVSVYDKRLLELKTA